MGSLPIFGPHAKPTAPLQRHILVMGVSGAGKTTVGRLLAQRLGCPFLDADHHHPPENVAKMRDGTPLTDEDRWPWLHALVRALDAHPHGAVLACSALTERYRELLSTAKLPVTFILLEGTRELIAARLQSRTGHYMNPALLESQFQTLEPSDQALRVSIEGTPEEIVQEALSRLAR